jgi:hypothetical protein
MLQDLSLRDFRPRGFLHQGVATEAVLVPGHARLDPRRQLVTVDVVAHVTGHAGVGPVGPEPVLRRVTGGAGSRVEFDRSSPRPHRPSHRGGPSGRPCCRGKKTG